MKFKDFMDLYEDWNGDMSVNDVKMKPIVSGNMENIMKHEKSLFNKKVVSFGFYYGELTVKIV